MINLEAKIIKDLTLKFNNLEEQKEHIHEFLFDITSVCNLNCTNCSVFCGLREPWFISIEEFREQLSYLKSIVPVSFVSFCGGEPTLHPQFMDLCKELFTQIPDCFLQIITNGTLLNKITDEDLKYLSQFKVSFAVTLYPKLKYIDIVQDFQNRCKKYNIEMGVKGIRPYFGKYEYNPKGSNDPDDFYYICEKSDVVHSFVIFKNRIYNCCIAPDYPAIHLPQDEEDSIQLNKLKSYDELLTFGNHSYNSCKYCTAQMTEGQPLHFWHTQNEVPSEYYSSMLELYLNNYELYYKLMHTYGEIRECLQNEYFLNNENKEEHSICDPVSHFKKRFTDGKVDIFIPFDKNASIIFLQQHLYQQKDLEKCNIYFISIDAGPEAEQTVYLHYLPLENRIYSFWYLKAKNNKDAFKVFLNNSFLNNKLILTDYSLLLNHNFISSVLNGENNLIMTKEQLEECIKNDQ